MLRHFFDNTLPKEPNLFLKMKIWKESSLYQNHYRQYPVISLSFKTIVYNSNFENFKSQFGELVANLYQEQCDLHKLDDKTKYIKNVLSKQANQSDLINSINKLINLLYGRYKQRKPVVLLLDGYDEVIRTAFFIQNSPYYECKEAVDFIHALLTKTLSNKFLYRSVLTGILPIYWDDTIENQKNYSICTVLDSEFRHSFGFFPAELEEKSPNFFKNKNLLSLMNKWYGGHHLSNNSEECLNPWSALNFIEDIDKSKKTLQLKNYWMDRENIEMSTMLLQHANSSSIKKFKKLTIGYQKAVKVIVNPRIDISSNLLDTSKFFSLLLFSGHLTIVKSITEGEEKKVYSLKIPNEEVLRFLIGIAQSFFKNSGAILTVSTTKNSSKVFLVCNKEDNEVNEQVTIALDDKETMKNREFAVGRLVYLFELNDLTAGHALIKLLNIDNMPMCLTQKIISGLVDHVEPEQLIHVVNALWKKLASKNEHIRDAANSGLLDLVLLNRKEIFPFLLRNLSDPTSKELQKIEAISILVKSKIETETVMIALKEMATVTQTEGILHTAATLALKKLESSLINCSDNKSVISNISGLIYSIPTTLYNSIPDIFSKIFPFGEKKSSMEKEDLKSSSQRKKRSQSFANSNLVNLTILNESSNSQSKSSFSSTSTSVSTSSISTTSVTLT